MTHLYCFRNKYEEKHANSSKEIEFDPPIHPFPVRYYDNLYYTFPKRGEEERIRIVFNIQGTSRAKNESPTQD